ncbi:unnamed protein product [Heligmosomoides polygyrus]|uniref:Apple domain-containing protein n=1 Tax=Heligmosomoides polygyrus TaxID=6339 RepID=A0A183GEW6_HELPZ|nr:unnamed protein product [Heligmosomoides polygyrus]
MNASGRSTHLSGVANYILAGFVEQVEDAFGIEQCISACYGALKHYGFQCMSAMWYPMDQKQVPFRHFYNCLLNSETKRTQEKMFIPEDTGHMMIYFEHPDALFMRRLHDETSFDEAKAPQLWTAWSSCHTSTERVRYQHCDDHVDIRKCPKEVARCGGTQTRPNINYRRVQLETRLFQT